MRSKSPTPASASRYRSPDDLYPELFSTVQQKQLYPDSKTFADATPKVAPSKLDHLFRQQAKQKEFELRRFLARYFELPSTDYSGLQSDPQRPLRAHIESLWDLLTRTTESEAPHSSLIALPFPFVVPGGRFREIYYWDSYFTGLGLAASGRLPLVEAMVKNFAWLIDAIGFVPNGNRSYYCSRSQPPFFALIVELLAQCKQQPDTLPQFLPQLETEYAFWMSGADRLTADGTATGHVVKIGDGFLNRYWDERDTPRPESYHEDCELAVQSHRTAEELYRDIRAGCESGWDFSSRWLADGSAFDSINTTQVLPIDLNALMYHLETVMAKAYTLEGNTAQASTFIQHAERRKTLIQSFCYCPQQQWYTDLWLPDLRRSQTLSLAGAYPLFFGIAEREQATAMAERIERDFLKPGGWVTTLNHSGQQWDAPNGWAPLQWIVHQGLQRYGFTPAAREGARRWVDNNRQVYQQSGKLLEKYNVEQVGLLAGGGEYEVQDGFGWTNGVLLRLMNDLGIE